MIKRNPADLNMRRLHHACADGDFQTAQHLLSELKVPPDAKDVNTETHRQTASERAAAKGRVELLKLLAKYDADFFVVSRSGMTLEAIVEKHLREGDFTTTHEEYEKCLSFIKEVKGLVKE